MADFGSHENATNRSDDCDGAFSPNATETVEFAILTVCVLLGGPINVYALHNTVRAFRSRPANRGRLLMLKINLNVADLCIVLVHGTSHAVWLFTTLVGRELLTTSFRSTYIRFYVHIREYA